jgi:hypothetical protein
MDLLNVKIRCVQIVLHFFSHNIIVNLLISMDLLWTKYVWICSKQDLACDDIGQSFVTITICHLDLIFKYF